MQGSELEISLRYGYQDTRWAGFRLDNYILWFDELGMNDVERVGGKNASFGEMISNLLSWRQRPNGFATTAHAYREFLAHKNLANRINQSLAALDIDNVTDTLAGTGAEIRSWIIDTPFQPALDQAIEAAFAKMTADNSGMEGCCSLISYGRGSSGCIFRGSARNIFKYFRY